MDTAKSGIDEVLLPCGYLKDDVLYDIVNIREITGEEEDILASPKMGVAQKMDSLIGNCINYFESSEERGARLESKADIIEGVRSLPIGDRVFMILALRRLSVSDEYVFEVSCPSCSYKNKKGLMLSDLDVTPMADKKLRVYDVSLPSGKKARMKIMLGKDEGKMDNIRKSSNNRMSQAILLRLDLLDDEPANITSVKKLSLRDRNAIRSSFEKYEGGVDTTIGVICSECEADFNTELDVSQSDFFFPSEQ